MPVVIQDGRVLITGGAVAMDVGLCCDNLCPVPACMWEGGQYAPLQSAYALSGEIWMAAGVPLGDGCQGTNHPTLYGDWSCSDSFALTLSPVATRCRFEAPVGNVELCPGNSDHEDVPLPANWTLLYGSTYLKYLPASNDWEIGITFKAGSNDWPVAATAAADSLGRPPSGAVWSFKLFGHTFADGACHVVGTDSAPSQTEIRITGFHL